MFSNALLFDGGDDNESVVTNSSTYYLNTIANSQEFSLFTRKLCYRKDDRAMRAI